MAQIDTEVVGEPVLRLVVTGTGPILTLDDGTVTCPLRARALNDVALTGPHRRQANDAGADVRAANPSGPADGLLRAVAELRRADDAVVDISEALRRRGRRGVDGDL